MTTPLSSIAPFTAGTGTFSPAPGQRIDPTLARSWLLVNAAQPERFAPAEDSAADIVVLDIEDAVAPKDKAAALQNTVDWLTSGHTAWVRLNGYGTPWWEQDMAALAATLPTALGGTVASGGLAGVVLAMVESTDHVNETAARLPGIPVVALVETARGLQRVNSIAAARGTFRLAFGIGDFRRDTGLGDSPMALAYTRSQFTIAAKATGLPGPIDGPTVGSTGVKLAEATAVTAEFGMTGKICLAPEQCAAVNEGLSPSQEELAWAHGFLTDFEADGGEIRNGSDLPRKARAEKILSLAEAFGVTSTRYPDQDNSLSAPSDTYHY
ncbi:Citrate lyase beta chain [Micrococcus lylae]|uniref:Citrate lyase beta chain n=1 Tax=Micrococcus lylae TaxID=1273 RepID=A0A1R4J1C9_9MICC|nr:CoA ester lyase [Micrococcus lylae]SJN25961.1 Citrate lyase beta chain [Micrococcus lylae]